MIYRFTELCTWEGHHFMNEKNTVNITISMTPSERKALKQVALDNDISVSALIRIWLEKNLAKGRDGNVNERE